MVLVFRKILLGDIYYKVARSRYLMTAARNFEIEWSRVLELCLENLADMSRDKMASLPISDRILYNGHNKQIQILFLFFQSDVCVLQSRPK